MEKRGSLPRGRSRVDTNVLVIGSMAVLPMKQKIATGILRRGTVEDSVRLPDQAILEFVAAVTRPMRGYVILKQADALGEAEELLKQFTVLYPHEGESPPCRSRMRGVPIELAGNPHRGPSA
jgi:hypothetical protein